MGVKAFPQRIYTNDSFISYWQTLNLSDGSWTTQDPLNFIHKLTWDPTNMNELELKAVASSTTDYNVNGGGTGSTNVTRLYKQAYYDNGTPVQAGDLFQITMQVPILASKTGVLRYFDWYLGIANDPTSTNVATFNFNGAGNGWNFANTDADAFATLVSGGVLSNSAPLAADDIMGYTTISFVAGVGQSAQVATDGAGTHKAFDALENNTSSISSVYLCLTIGARGTARAFALSDGTYIQAKYKISKLYPGA